MAKMANKDLNLVANVGHADKTCPRDAMVDGSRDAVAPSKAGGSMRAAIPAMPRRFFTVPTHRLMSLESPRYRPVPQFDDTDEYEVVSNRIALTLSSWDIY
ncbi:unnamed protein product [Heligmosomoides polygyrus]|uniref:Uncharacterized protein n=1 Tax=Heligmosomoides polygyrus TaxID=6339 RepID=A0A183FZK1_HELPZ|nr:unnamed protein product [Heligmosomoides polygyrus]